MSLRIALVLNPLTLHRMGGEHAPFLARELLGRGHAVRAFGDVSGDVPQSGLEGGTGRGAAPLERAGLRTFEPDVILAYDGHSPAAWRAARAARELEVPLVLVEAGFPSRGKPVERVLRRIGRLLWGSLVRRTVTRVLALDHAAERQAMERGFPAEIISVQPSGVDGAVFRPGLASDVLHRNGVRGRVLLHLGRVEPGRGIEVLIHAFARTLGRLDDWSLVFCGNGSFRPGARAVAERLGIGASVHWTGISGPAELPGLIASATALLVPVLDNDVASLKIRRAMACGVPVLASDVARLSGLVENDVNGLVVEAGDLDAWRAAIARFAADPARRERWGREALEHAQERFLWPKVAGRVEDLLASVVEASRTAGQRAREAAELEAAGLPSSVEEA
ncbi:MAG: glycosyltransferase family 4 protein [Planctomycetota bacterium]|jgi:glycosyltransferase involved in cell wall biosynthesis